VQLGGYVTVIIPSAKIAARWNGALQARLRHAPLEAFLRSRGQKWVLSGETRITDNLACATMFLVGAAVNAYTEERRGPLAAAQHPVVGQIACTVSSSLALLIQEPTLWRIAALVATARLLEKHIGLSAAAHAAAAAAREFSSTVGSGSHDAEVSRIGHAARGAAETNEEADTSNAVRLIVQRLSSITTHASVDAPDAAASSYEVEGATFSSSTT
jgi:hypothetical protein